MTELGYRLRRLREEHQWTQEHVARLADIGYSSYRRYETESVLPRMDQLGALAKLYDKTMDELLGIGTVYTLEYDQSQMTALRKALDASDWHQIKEALDPLLEQRNAALRPPDLTDDMKSAVTLGWKGDLRTIRFNAADDQLILDAMEKMYELKIEEIQGRNGGRN